MDNWTYKFMDFCQAIQLVTCVLKEELWEDTLRDMEAWQAQLRHEQ